MEKKITGVMVYYYEVCHRKLWYFSHDVLMEQENENVQIGKVLDEGTYLRDEKHINIDNVINIDFIKSKGVLHEIKKSRKIEEASELQVKYYLYYLKQRGVDMKAKIDYPLLRQTVEIVLTEADCHLLDHVLEEIQTIIEKKEIPKCQKKNICKSCAYYDLCWV